MIDVTLLSSNGDRRVLLLRKHDRMEGLGVVFVSGIAREELERLRRDSQANAVVHKEELAAQLPFALLRAFHSHR